MVDEYWLENYVTKASDANSLALDIGANVGEWSCLLSKHFKQVLSVEPDPRAFQKLETSVPSSVFCKNAAVSAKSGSLNLYMRDSALQSSLLMDHPIGGSGAAEAPIVETLEIESVTLDGLANIFKDLSIAFIKVDVEGAEGDVLEGATDDVFGRVKWLIEIHDREEEVMTQLKRLGYDSPIIIKHPNPAAHPKHFWIYAEPN
jgi:FkbM family methyltransferase